MILASGSPRRKELLSLLLPSFTIEPSQVSEDAGAMPPGDLVAELAQRKARSVAQGREECLVIGADTVVALSDKILGKPESREDAKRMLRLLSGKAHQVYTGVCLLWGKQKSVFYEMSVVSFASMEDREIDWYIDTGEPMDKAGAYGVQGAAARFIQEIHGDYFNVMGLPVHRLYQHLRMWFPQTQTSLH